MDVAQIASAAAALLAAKSADGFAAEIGKAAWERLSGLISAVRDALSHDPSSKASVHRAAAEPGNDGALADLADAIARRVGTDPEFASQVRDLVALGRTAASVNTIMINGEARVGKVVSIRDVHGDVSL